MNQAVDAMGAVSGARRKLFLRDAPVVAGLGYGAYDVSQGDGSIRSWLRNAFRTEKRDMAKEAGLGDILRRQIGRIKPGELGGRAVNKVVDTLVRNPKLEEAVRGVLSYNLVDPRNRSQNAAMGALAGVLPGAGVGFAQSDKGKGGTDSVTGALTGALLGAAGGRYGPRAAQAGVGRVLTNVMDPHIYNGAMHAADFKNLYKEHGIKGIVRSIVKDEPLQEIAPAR